MTWRKGCCTVCHRLTSKCGISGLPSAFGRCGKNCLHSLRFSLLRNLRFILYKQSCWINLVLLKWRNKAQCYLIVYFSLAGPVSWEIYERAKRLLIFRPEECVVEAVRHDATVIHVEWLAAFRSEEI